MKNKKVLVTGGAGFIGSNLVRELIETGNFVVVLDNFSSGHIENIPLDPSLRIVYGDIRDNRAVESAMPDIDVIFHLAASVGNKRSIDDPIADAQTNVLGTLRILEAARKFRVKKLVISSSAGIFGELKTLPIKEDHPIEPDSPYGCTKLCEEKLGLSYAKMYDMNVICLRYFNVYGINQRFDAYGNVIPIFVHRMLNMEPLTVYGDGEQTRDFVNVKDVVQANIKAAESIGISGAYNIGSGGRVTINRLISLMCDDIPFHGAVNEPERLGDVKHSLADISAAQRDLGYEPQVGLPEGIKEYINWRKNI
jgi:UDP-glucose 4-epimerase